VRKTIDKTEEMKMGAKFFVCEHCGNLVGMIHDAGVPMMCCGQKMTALVPNTVEASGEKHKPVVKVEGNTVTVNVGSVDHPMLSEHFIEWVYVQTENGGQRKALKPDDKPNVTFCLGDDKAVAVYAYCNLHGLWKNPCDFRPVCDRSVHRVQRFNIRTCWSGACVCR